MDNECKCGGSIWEIFFKSWDAWFKANPNWTKEDLEKAWKEAEQNQINLNK